MDEDKVRVKLFALSDDAQWEVRGIGHLSLYEIRDSEDGNLGFRIVIVDEESDDNILESYLNPDSEYKLSDETLITWEEGGRNLVMSFEDESHCKTTFLTIITSLKRLESCEDDESCPHNEGDADNSSSSVMHTSIELSRSKMEELQSYPPCDYEHLAEVASVFSDLATDPARRETLSMYAEQENIVPKLVNIFRICEDMEDVVGLHNLYTIVRALFFLSQFSIFEAMLSSENIMDIVGILEYNPNLDQKLDHRKVLASCRPKQVAPYTNVVLIDLISHTHRLQYVQDIVLPTPNIFEERQSLLSSFVFFRKNEIVEMVVEDDEFLSQLFNLLLDDEITDDQRKETASYLVELCNFSRTLRSENKETFLAQLVRFDVMSIIQRLMNLNDYNLKSSLVEITSRIAEHQPNLIRECFVASIEKSSSLLVQLAQHMYIDPEDNSSLLVVSIFKTVLDTTNISKDDSKVEMSDFLSSFYCHCIDTVMSPIFASTTDSQLKNDSHSNALALELAIEILICCIDHHSYSFKNYIVKSDVLKRIVVLLNSKHLFLAHGAVNVIRKALSSRDELYSRYMCREGLFDHFIKAIKTSHKKYDIVNSAIIELFEFVRASNNKLLLTSLVQNHREFFEATTYVPTFTRICLQYDQMVDYSSHANGARKSSSPSRSNSRRSVSKSKDSSWFDSESPEEDVLSPKVSSLVDSPACSPRSATFSGNGVVYDGLADDQADADAEAADEPELPSIKPKVEDDDFVLKKPVRVAGPLPIKITLKRTSMFLSSAEERDVSEAVSTPESEPVVSSKGSLASGAAPHGTPLVDYPDYEDDESNGGASIRAEADDPKPDVSCNRSDEETPSVKKPKIVDTI